MKTGWPRRGIGYDPMCAQDAIPPLEIGAQQRPDAICPVGDEGRLFDDVPDSPKRELRRESVTALRAFNYCTVYRAAFVINHHSHR
ncbi:hypothetical protein, partial [Mesorhizobium sp. M1C.F.Ca.ET.192.01.1.1]|uniref:hypothetical protein n=1 Tax=Mesorhizobium sp. M1C.F.Ca.ET.192.01.1.1 TaxID=2496667 RepID=UPI001AEEEC37